MDGAETSWWVVTDGQKFPLFHWSPENIKLAIILVINELSENISRLELKECSKLKLGRSHWDQWDGLWL